MSNLIPDDSEVADVRNTVIWFLAIATLVALVVLILFSWLDARRTPMISFHSTPESILVVDVRGAVSTPGVIELAPGSRMIDVISAVGGFSPEADQSLVNLSTRVNDGQMIVVPAIGTIDQPDLNGLINLNTASREELKQLPGIGDVLADRIVAYREFSGPFQSVDDLVNIEGISSGMLEELRPLVTVSGDD